MIAAILSPLSSLVSLVTLDGLVAHITTPVLQVGRLIRFAGQPADSVTLTIQELLLLALVALVVAGVSEWRRDWRGGQGTTQHITWVLVGISIVVVSAFPLLLLANVSVPQGLLIENILVLPAGVGTMLLMALFVGTGSRRIQSRHQVVSAGALG
jgi:hypothetical protein